MNQKLNIPETLPGIDIRKAVSNLGGNQKLFVKVVLEFKKQYNQIPNDISESLKAGDTHLARQLSHKIKGVSGMFCAGGLFQASADLENALKQNQNPDDILHLFDHFKHYFDQVIESAAFLERHISSSDLYQDTSPEFDSIPLDQAIASMIQLVKQKSPKVEKILNSIKPRLLQLGFQKEINRLEDQLDQYNFASSYSTLISLAESLSSQPSTNEKYLMKSDAV